MPTRYGAQALLAEDEEHFPTTDEGMVYQPPVTESDFREVPGFEREHFRSKPPGAAQLVSGPGAMPSPGVPRGPNLQPSPKQVLAGDQPTTPPTTAYKPLTKEAIARWKQKRRQEFPDMSERDFEAHIQYGLAKKRGRIAAREKKIFTKPASQYFSLLQQEQMARTNVEALHESLQHHRFAEDDEGWVPYQNRINAAIKRTEAITQRRKDLQLHLEKLGIKPEYLANPVTVLEFMRGLEMGAPPQASEIPDDEDLLNEMLMEMQQQTP